MVYTKQINMDITLTRNLITGVIGAIVIAADRAHDTYKSHMHNAK